MAAVIALGVIEMPMGAYRQVLTFSYSNPERMQDAYE